MKKDCRSQLSLQTFFFLIIWTSWTSFCKALEKNVLTYSDFWFSKENRIFGKNHVAKGNPAVWDGERGRMSASLKHYWNVDGEGQHDKNQTIFSLPYFPSLSSMPGWRTLSFSGLSAHLWTSKLPTWVRLKTKNLKELPWWLSGFDPWSERAPHGAEQLSPCATTTEPVLYSLGATTTEALTSDNPRSTGQSLRRGACASPLESSPTRRN